MVIASGASTGQSSANTTILKMISDDSFGLGGFELVESSEQGMLAQVQRAVQSGGDIVFFGWRPHPMNVRYDIEYLTDGNDVFGPNDGAATVMTNTRAGFSKDCPNLGKFLSNLAFTVEAEDLMMSYILDEGMEPRAAAERWLKDNPGAATGNRPRARPGPRRETGLPACGSNSSPGPRWRGSAGARPDVPP